MPPADPNGPSIPYGAGTTVATPVAPAAPAAPSILSNVGPDSGLWVGVALVGGIALSGTRAAPIVAGILGVALIYQLQLLLQGK